MKLSIHLAILLPFLPSTRADDAPSGWRNDGTGKYPAVPNPPLRWSRVSAAVNALRSAPTLPNDDHGAPLPDGVIRQWQVAGPVPFDKSKADAPLEEPAAAAWKTVTLDSAYLDFNRLLGKPATTDVAAYAAAHVFSPDPGRFRINLTAIAGGQLFVNGKRAGGLGGRTNVDLQKGWNRILLRVSPGEKDWYVVPVLAARGQPQYKETNVRWRTPLPGAHPAFYGGGSGSGSPVVVGGNLYLQSEPHDLICLDKSDGKIRWIRRASYFEAATDDDKKHPDYADAATTASKIDALNAAVLANAATPAQLEEKIKLERDLHKAMRAIDRKRYAVREVPDVGLSGFTPSTDGKFVYAFFGDGITACFDLDGNRRWIRVDQQPPVEHGFSASPLLIDGKFVSIGRGLVAADAATGKLDWQTPIVSDDGFNPGNFSHGSLAAARVAGIPVIVTGNGTIVRAADGRVLWKQKAGDTQSCPTPVVDGRRVYLVTHGNSALTTRTLPPAPADPLDLDSRTVKVDVSAFPNHYLPWHLCSPIVHDGLAYLITNAGVLSVVDVDAGTICYQRLLDLDVFQGHNEGAARGVGISPILVGNHLYVFGNNGAALIIEAGRTYRQLAKNKLESIALSGHWSERQERFTANPILDGNRLFVRGESHLYCIGAE